MAWTFSQYRHISLVILKVVLLSFRRLFRQSKHIVFLSIWKIWTYHQSISQYSFSNFFSVDSVIAKLFFCRCVVTIDRSYWNLNILHWFIVFKQCSTPILNAKRQTLRVCSYRFLTFSTCRWWHSGFLRPSKVGVTRKVVFSFSCIEIMRGCESYALSLSLAHCSIFSLACLRLHFYFFVLSQNMHLS